ncbi:FABP family protein [Naumannella halotolerans]|uniref:Ferric nitrobindin-like protein n=1 Tax=Naumannella halotolerans TaxID=993414 RepID=A0A4R7J0V3_9ACTN|nr:FABP family protein [Naumannella halotolerans]TDT30016.1 uncharacterized protein DUF1794 [Naumannella halotolerans]
MAFEIPDDLNPNLLGLAWMLGRWEGSGKGTWPGVGEFDYGQQVDVTHNGADYLHYLSQTFEVDDAGKAVRPLSMETGFWRASGDGELDLVLAHPEGYAEIWYGKSDGAKIELTTDAVMRTKGAEPVTGGQRLYGNVEGDLLWTWDRATTEVPLQAFMWARLQRAAA